MRPPMRLEPALLTTIAAAALAVLAAHPSSSHAVSADGMVQLASVRECGAIKGGINASNIKALRVSCGKARRVVRSFLRQARTDGEFDREVRGFHCKTIGSFGIGGGYRCAAKGQRVIRFITGG